MQASVVMRTLSGAACCKSRSPENSILDEGKSQNRHTGLRHTVPWRCGIEISSLIWLVVLGLMAL